METFFPPYDMRDAIRRHVVACRLARQAGVLLMDRLGREEPEHKGEVEFVTAADRASEALILAGIREAFPEDAIFAEESGGATEVVAREGFRWIVDPLDGTTNFVHGNPLFAVSIALEYDQEVVAGVIVHPFQAETFEVQPMGRATLSGRPIHVSATQDVSRALFVTGFPYDRRQHADDLLARVKRAMLIGHGIRRSGSAALDLAWLACGRFDAYWEQGLAPYDVAAGALLVRRAGGRVTTWSGEEHHLGSDRICATNGAIHDHVLAAICSPLT